MIRIVHFTNPRLAQAFIDYMNTCGVKLSSVQEEGITLWLEDATHYKIVEQELERFVRDPNHPRYQIASWQSGDISSKLQYQTSSLLPVLRDRTGPLTLTVIIAAIIVYVLMQLSENYAVLHLLAWPAENQKFQLWRWFSHILLHFTFWHILFNLFWWWYVGGLIEKQLGSGKLFVLTVVAALLSGWMQASVSGVMFGGLSGVVYALIGYAWLRGERDVESGIYLERGLMSFAVLWLIIGYLDVFAMGIANAAHLTGLLLGLAMAFVDIYSARR